MLITERSGYSAKVDIRLQVNGSIIDVAQVSRQFLILREPAHAAPDTQGKVIVTIDGREHVFPVLFHDGIDPQSRRVTFSRIDCLL